ncbi:MAG: delta-aminolevulinic acid dehydratase [Omnitrophica bacterium RIFCSPHIGHO2_02_FULL_63_14]|nr:MAG: delta-aminolevulinic acid dehydratase [Omnitrophica bacterium RIFCSPHIGHO2_02_FULL_63_14]
MSPARFDTLTNRPRRLRGSEALRGLVRETRLSAEQLVMPLFVRPGTRVRAPIPSMPGQFQLSVDAAAEECRKLHEDGVPAVLLFGLADRKDERASRAYARDGIVQQAVGAIKRAAPDLFVITDVCLCAYMSHGHCGVLKIVRGSGLGVGGKKGSKPRTPNPEPRTEKDFYIENDATLELLAKTAVSYAGAGADMVAPSDMMDGTVGCLRRALDGAGFERTPIMAYAAKFASAFYGPFRDAVDSAPCIGDRRTYQMDPANAEEAVREAALDVQQGADVVMVKPALAYLDIVRAVKEALHVPVAAFNVSGEYAMVKAASARGWLPEAPTWMEMLLAMKRAGADILITYWAREAAKLLKKS